MTKENKGRFIVFGGLDETGKSTQSAHLVRHLQGLGKSVVHTYEPGGTSLGRELRNLLLGSNGITPKTALLLFQAAREEHLTKVIRPALARGEIVVCDRFFESSFIYQGMQGLSDAFLLSMHELLGQNDPEPDLHLMFTGRVGEREETNHFDAFCDANRSAMTERVARFAKLVPSYVIEVTGRTEEDIFSEVVSVLSPLLF